MTTMTTVAGVQRAMGCLVGAAVGDALGAPFEFGPAGQWSERFPAPVLGGVGEMIGGGAFGWAPGQFTDDTEMATIVAESLLACGGIDVADQFTRFQAWAAHANDVGSTTSAVLHSGLPPHEAAESIVRNGRGRGTAGNGSLMRVTPGAIHFAHLGREGTVLAGRRLSAVTHADPLCVWAVAVVHDMVRLALAGDDPFEAIRAVIGMMPADVAAVYGPLLDPAWHPGLGCPSNGSAMGALAQAVWAVRSSSGFAETVTKVIDLGGDTDSVAAVAGALAGARWGIQAIPSRWQTYVHGVVTQRDGTTRRYDHTDLQRLAMSLFGWPHPNEAVDEPVMQPKEVVPGVWASNRAGARTVDDSFAVISLCRIDAAMRRPVRREVFLIDRPGEYNPSLDEVLDDVLDTIDAFVGEGRQVLVHCHGGRSRTGLVLTAYLMRHGHSFDDATYLLEEWWPPAHLRNESFADAARRRAGRIDRGEVLIAAALRNLSDDHRAEIRRLLAELAAGSAGDWVVTDPPADGGPIHMPWMRLSAAAERLMETLYAAGLVVPFDWGAWIDEHGGQLPPIDPSFSADDAVRAVTAIVRSDRFSEGSFASHLEDGTLPALLEVVLGAPGSSSAGAKGGFGERAVDS